MLRRLDPKIRLVAALVFAVAVVTVHSFAALGLGLVFALGLLAVARLPAAATLRKVIAVDGFIVVLLATLPFTTPGTPVFTLWGLDASAEGFAHAVRIALKANAVMLALLSLVGTLEEPELGHALARLRVPEKLVALFLMTARYIHVLAEEYHRLRTAMKARGFRPRLDLHTLRSLGYLVGMLLVRALERSERVLAAMKCRGYTGRYPVLSDRQPGIADMEFSAVLAVVVAGLLALEHWSTLP